MATVKQLTNRIRLRKKTVTRLERELKEVKLRGKKLQNELSVAKMNVPAKKKAKSKKKSRKK